METNCDIRSSSELSDIRGGLDRSRKSIQIRLQSKLRVVFEDRKIGIKARAIFGSLHDLQ